MVNDKVSNAIICRLIIGPPRIKPTLHPPRIRIHNPINIDLAPAPNKIGELINRLPVLNRPPAPAPIVGNIADLCQVGHRLEELTEDDRRVQKGTKLGQVTHAYLAAEALDGRQVEMELGLEGGLLGLGVAGKLLLELLELGFESGKVGLTLLYLLV
jgi:hypothetical protein